MQRWGVEYWDAQWYVMQGDHLHPIPFDSEKEAVRAAARLNKRDEALT